jgi:probable HAF family extracellular repeat protein
LGAAIVAVGLSTPAAWASTDWSGWGFEQLPPGYSVWPADINDEGVVVGFTTEPVASNRGVLTTLPTLAGATRSVPVAVNNAGTIVGYSELPNVSDAVLTLWTSNGVSQTTPAVTVHPETPLGMNASGQVVGGTGSPSHAFLWSQGTFLDLGTFGGASAVATSINDTGTIVGAVTDQAGIVRAFVRFPDGSWHVIGLPPGYPTIEARSVKVNNLGQIVYNAGTPPNLRQAYVWQNYRATPLVPNGCAAGASVAVRDIDAAGQIAGDCDSFGFVWPFLWKSGTTTLLPKPTELNAFPVAMNNVGDVVGLADLMPEATFPVVWHQSGLVWGDVYTTPGFWVVNGREWNTTCQPYSTTATRCTALIKATQVKLTATGFVAVTDFVFNNLTYTDRASSAWSTNPLAVTGTFTSAGRLWSTTCSPSVATGPRTCRTYIWATVYGRTALSTGGYTYWQKNQWVFNNMVVLS